MTQPSAESVEDLPLADQRRLVVSLIEEVGRLTVENRELKDEIARLKGLPPRPRFKGKPSGMETASSEVAGSKKGSRRRRGSKRDKLTGKRGQVMSDPSALDEVYGCFPAQAFNHENCGVGPKGAPQ